MNNKKTIISVITIAVLVIVLTVACGGSAVPDRIVGEWACDKTASDQTTYTGCYVLTISDDGTFSLTDVEAGNPGISGSMKGDDTGKIGILELDCDEDEFNPPSCWQLKTNSRVRYKIIDDDTIRLGFTGIWLTFRK